MPNIATIQHEFAIAGPDGKLLLDNKGEIAVFSDISWGEEQIERMKRDLIDLYGIPADTPLEYRIVFRERTISDWEHLPIYDAETTSTTEEK